VLQNGRTVWAAKASPQTASGRNGKEPLDTYGSEIVLEGVTGNGSRFVYLSGSAGVPYIEIVDPQGPMATFFAYIATSAENWDGSNPIR
jgi:hypothetical protein